VQGVCVCVGVCVWVCFICFESQLLLTHDNVLEQGFSNCDTRTTVGTPVIVHWYAGIVTNIKE
jgi:hypothetical protein